MTDSRGEKFMASTLTLANADATSRPTRAATDPNGPTGRLATWLANTTLDDIPPSVRERAKHLLLDGVACALVGAQLPVSRKGLKASQPSTMPGAPYSSVGVAARPVPRRPRCSILGARGVAAEHHRVAARSRRRQRSPRAGARLL